MSGQALAGRRVLVPLAGRWAHDLAERLGTEGATAEVIPLIAFDAPEDGSALTDALARLANGDYDWLIVTSATAVDSLERAGARIPIGTRLAVAGEHTADAARAAGFAVDVEPGVDHSAHALVTGWPNGPGRVLLPQSELADETLAEGLGALGLDVDRVGAYRAIPVPVDAALSRAVAAGEYDAIVLTAGSVAARVADEFRGLPVTTHLIAIGARTAAEADAAGLPVAAIAAGRGTAEIVDVLVGLLGPRP